MWVWNENERQKTRLFNLQILILGTALSFKITRCFAPTSPSPVADIRKSRLESGTLVGLARFFKMVLVWSNDPFPNSPVASLHCPPGFRAKTFSRLRYANQPLEGKGFTQAPSNTWTCEKQKHFLHNAGQISVWGLSRGIRRLSRGVKPTHSITVGAGVELFFFN